MKHEPVQVERVEVEATRVVLPDEQPKAIELVVEPGAPGNLLLIFTARQDVPFAFVQPFAVLRCDEEGLARFVACGVLARVVVGNARAIDWLKKRLATGKLPGAPGANIPVETDWTQRAGWR